MKKYINPRIATATTIGAFFITSLSGLIIFFEFEINGIRPLHEWGSIVLVLGVFWHVYSHRRSFNGYFKNKQLIAIMLFISLSGTGLFVISINDVFIAAVVEQRVVNLNLQGFSRAMGLDIPEVRNQLQAFGASSIQPEDSVQLLSEKYGFEVHEFLEKVLVE